MGKLHELLAVEDDRKNVYQMVLKETTKVFGQNNLFVGFHRTLEKKDEERCPDSPDEHLELTTTVYDRIKYTFDKAAEYIDIVLKKESTNQQAKAAIVIDQKAISEELPATFLLGLEAKLKALRDVLNRAPTLPSGIEVVPDEEKGEHIYRRKYPEENMKTIKTIQHKVLYAHTDKHPAQIEKWSEDEIVGKFIRHVWFGFLSSREKADILDRLDILYQAVKKARQRANNTDVVNSHVAKRMFDYVLDGKV